MRTLNFNVSLDLAKMSNEMDAIKAFEEQISYIKYAGRKMIEEEFRNPCSQCNGLGYINGKPCSLCHGYGNAGWTKATGKKPMLPDYDKSKEKVNG